MPGVRSSSASPLRLLLDLRTGDMSIESAPCIAATSAAAASRGPRHRAAPATCPRRSTTRSLRASTPEKPLSPSRLSRAPSAARSTAPPRSVGRESRCCAAGPRRRGRGRRGRAPSRRRGHGFANSSSASAGRSAGPGIRGGSRRGRRAAFVRRWSADRRAPRWRRRQAPPPLRQFTPPPR